MSAFTSRPKLFPIGSGGKQNKVHNSKKPPFWGCNLLFYSVEKPILGTYRKTIQVYHYYNPQTGVDTMIDPSGNFIVGWKLSPSQIENLFRNGNVQ